MDYNNIPCTPFIRGCKPICRQKDKKKKTWLLIKDRSVFDISISSAISNRFETKSHARPIGSLRSDEWNVNCHISTNFSGYDALSHNTHRQSARKQSPPAFNLILATNSITASWAEIRVSGCTLRRRRVECAMRTRRAVYASLNPLLVTQNYLRDFTNSNYRSAWRVCFRVMC